MSSRLDPLTRNYYRCNNYRQTAGYPKREWTTEEMNLILAHSVPDRQLSARIQRSVQSIQVMRCRLRSK